MEMINANYPNKKLISFIPADDGQDVFEKFFQLYDADGDGKISKVELKEFIKYVTIEHEKEN